MQEIGGSGVASNEKSSNLGLGTFFKCPQIIDDYETNYTFSLPVFRLSWRR
jgi:hypothetical protein